MDFHDYQVDLCDLDGCGSYNLGYQTFGRDGRAIVDWRVAKQVLPKKQRLHLWPAVMGSLRKVMLFVGPPKVVRKIPAADAGHRRDTDVTALLAELGYDETKRFTRGNDLIRLYRKK
jgi:hypothetical protein